MRMPMNSARCKTHTAAVLLCWLTVCLLSACDTHTTFRSSVPSYPVYLKINTALGMYVNFVPENIYTYLIADADGYHFNGQTMPRTELDRFGYAGVVVYIDGFGQYNAFDMACPHCLKQKAPVEIDGMFAVCPTCGEEYDLSSGYATPQKAISTEALRKYSLLVSDGVIVIRN